MDPEITTAPPESRGKFPVPTAVVAGGAFALVALAVVWMVSVRAPSSGDAALTEEAAAYAPQVRIEELRLSVADNFLNQQVIYLDGRVINNGSRAVRHLRLQLHFYDTLNQVILRTEQDVVRPTGQSLQAGESRNFQLGFDRIPPSWNVQPPEWEIVALRLE
jgi:hypothetical protein